MYVLKLTDLRHRENSELFCFEEHVLCCQDLYSRRNQVERQDQGEGRGGREG